MPESTQIRVKRDGQIILSDDGALSTYTIAYEPGDLTIDIAHRYDGGHVESEWASTSAGDVFTVNCSVVFSGAELGEADEQLDFAFCVVRASLSEGDPNTVNVTITSYVTKPTKV